VVWGGGGVGGGGGGGMCGGRGVSVVGKLWGGEGGGRSGGVRASISERLHKVARWRGACKESGPASTEI